MAETVSAEPVTTPASTPVIISSPLASKINWTQVITLLVGLAASFGLVIPTAWQDIVLKGAVILGPILTLVFRNLWTGNKVATPAAVKAAAK